MDTSNHGRSPSPFRSRDSLSPPPEAQSVAGELSDERVAAAADVQGAASLLETRSHTPEVQETTNLRLRPVEDVVTISDSPPGSPSSFPRANESKR